MFVLQGNVAIFVVAGIVRRRFAGGILIAIAVNFLIATLMGVFLNATCAIPFFVDTTQR